MLWTSFDLGIGNQTSNFFPFVESISTSYVNWNERILFELTAQLQKNKILMNKYLNYPYLYSLGLLKINS